MMRARITDASFRARAHPLDHARHHAGFRAGERGRGLGRWRGALAGGSNQSRRDLRSCVWQTDRHRFVFLAGHAERDRGDVGWRSVGVQIVGVGMLGGIGFTMSLFIANLAFGDSPALETGEGGHSGGVGHIRNGGSNRAFETSEGYRLRRGGIIPVHLKFFRAWLLTARCVVVHAIGVMALLRWGSNAVTRMGSRFWFFDVDARSHSGVYHSPVVMMLIATLTASLATNSG